MQYDTYQKLTLKPLNSKNLSKIVRATISSEEHIQKWISDLPGYLLCANDTFTLALVCAWRGDWEFTSQREYTDENKRTR